MHRLMLKLRAHGISGKIWNWIQEWLSNRKQRVCPQGCIFVMASSLECVVVEKFNVVLFSKSVSRWIFAYAFAFDNVF